jgi:hypothetical protein
VPRLCRLGRRRSGPRNLEVAFLVENRPRNAGQLVGKRDRKHVMVQPLLGGFDPRLEPVALPTLRPDQQHPGGLRPGLLLSRHALLITIRSLLGQIECQGNAARVLRIVCEWRAFRRIEDLVALRCDFWRREHVIRARNGGAREQLDMECSSGRHAIRCHCQKGQQASAQGEL